MGSGDIRRGVTGQWQGRAYWPWWVGAGGVLPCVRRIPDLPHKTVQNPNLVMLVLIVTIVA